MEMIHKYLSLVAILLFLVSCTTGRSNPIATPTNTISTSTPPAPSITTVPTNETEPGMTITATVRDVWLSARIIVLERPVEGFSIIALTEESELVSADGSKIALRDIQRGVTIQASGHPGESNALIASQVLVLGAAPTFDPMEMILPPASTPSPILLSLNPQNPVHVFIVIPLATALTLLLIGGGSRFVLWKWLRTQDDETEVYRNSRGQVKGMRARHALSGLLFWVALSALCIFDLLGSASLYPAFVAIYATFWVPIGALLLYDRPMREKVLILAVFVTLIFSLRFFDWNSRKPFLRDFYRIKEGMPPQQVEQIMGGYPRSVGTNAKVDDGGYLVTGNVSYTHTDEGWGNSDIGLLTFQGGRVAEIEFLPD
jgi:hypothetical protein